MVKIVSSWKNLRTKLKIKLSTIPTMTDSEKVFALTEILGDVIHTLELKQYDIEDPQLSHECVTDADKFHQRMLDILYPKEN